MSKIQPFSCVILCLFFLASPLWAGGQEEIIVQTCFIPINKVYPEYPAQLKKEGEAARFLVFISIDKKGRVTRASAHNRFYPELEENIGKAFDLWTFEPYIHEGKPIRVAGIVEVIFFPGKLSLSKSKKKDAVRPPESEFSIPVDKDLQIILDKCSEYCLRLSESALFYICNEKVNEKTRTVKGPRMGISFTPPRAYSQSFDMTSFSYAWIALEDPKKHVFLHDYQLIRKEDKIEERRLLLEKDGEAVDPKGCAEGVEGSYYLTPVLAPVQILGLEQRHKFFFERTRDERVKGNPVYVLEAQLRSGQISHIKRGRIWIDKSDFRVVKMELETDFIEGYEEIFEECNYYYLKPHFISTHFYEVDKNKLLFPSRSEVRVEYSGFLGLKRDVKSEIKISYSDYKFFIVETDHNIIKKKLEAFFEDRGKLILQNSLRFVPYVIR